MSRGAHASIGAVGSIAPLDRVSTSRAIGTVLATLQLGCNIAEKIAIAPANRSLILPELDESRCRRTTIHVGQRIQGLKDFFHFALKPGKIRVFAVTQVRCLFRPGLDELEHQIDRAAEISRGPFVLSDCSRPIAKSNRTLTKRVWKNSVSYQAPILLEYRRRWHEPRVEKSPIEIAGFVQISNDAQEPRAVHAIETGLYVSPCCRFLIHLRAC